MDVAVIGAGISGLTTAKALRDAGHEVIVFDKGKRCGGRMHSERLGGFLMEHGPTAIRVPAPRTEGLIAGVGLASETLERGARAGRRYVVRGGRIHPVHVRPHRFFLSGFLSPAGCVRLLMEPFVPRERRDETVANFTRRRFGREVLDYLADPLAAGLCGGDPEQLSVSAVLPGLKRLERAHGSIILAALKCRVRSGAGESVGEPALRTLLSFSGGLGALPQAIRRHLAKRLFLNQSVESVRRAAGGGFLVTAREGGVENSLKADSVVIALPAHAAARVIAPLAPETAETLAEIGHPPLAVAFLGYRGRMIPQPLDGAGVLAPSVEKRNVLGIVFSSALFAGRAPPGYLAVTAILGGARQPHLAMLEPTEITELAHAEARELLDAREAPVMASVRRWRHGLPQPGLDHAARMETLAALERAQPGLFFTGNYLRGVSVPACIDQAYVTAARVDHYLGTALGCRRATNPLRRNDTPVAGDRRIAPPDARAAATSSPR